MKMILFLILIACFGHGAKAHQHHSITVNPPRVLEEASRPALDPSRTWHWDSLDNCFYETTLWHDEGSTYWCQIPDANGHIYWQEFKYTWRSNAKFILAIIFLAGIVVGIVT